MARKAGVWDSWCLLKNPVLLVSAAAATGGSVINVAALLASGTQVTPQIAMAAQMAALQAKALAETGIAVPSYYNPAAVNPMKFAEQEKKRKMLWQGKKEGVILCAGLSSVGYLWGVCTGMFSEAVQGYPWLCSSWCFGDFEILKLEIALKGSFAGPSWYRN